MSKLIDVRCVLAVNDLEKSTEFYRDKLGLKLDFQVDGWSFLSRDSFSVMLGHCPAPETAPASELGNHNYYAYVSVKEIDDLYAEYTAREVPILQKLETKPWDMREFCVRTPEGHRIVFGMEVV